MGLGVCGSAGGVRQGGVYENLNLRDHRGWSEIWDRMYGRFHFVVEISTKNRISRTIISLLDVNH